MAAFLLIAMAAFPMGCASSNHNLVLTSLKQHQTFRQNFTQAYAAGNDQGGTDVILVDPAAQQAMNGYESSAPVRQIMHIRVMWVPTRDMRAEASNAAVAWYVIGRSLPDVLEYTGTAFVYLESQGDGTTSVVIRDATVKRSKSHGSLTDPVGPSRIQGTVIARQDKKMVNRLLHEMQTTVAVAGGMPGTVAQTDLRSTDLK
ncbi:MAG TPA: hypothetical protein VFC78_19980 [Tepidisphaeraceae bacterium]|nr:hypothetical protein [Tepidisphaeraceae bacterium]